MRNKCAMRFDHVCVPGEVSASGMVIPKIERQVFILLKLKVYSILPSMNASTKYRQSSFFRTTTGAAIFFNEYL